MAEDKNFMSSRLVIVLNALALVVIAVVIFVFFRVYSDRMGKYGASMTELFFVGHIFVLSMSLLFILSVLAFVFLRRSQRKMLDAIEQLRVTDTAGRRFGKKSKDKNKINI